MPPFHKFSRVIREYPTRGIYTGQINNIWCVDLVDLTSIGCGFILNCIDVFSRKIEAVKMDGKSADDLEQALNQLYIKYGAKPLKIWSDKEPGLWGELRKKLLINGIQIYSLNNSYIGAKSHSSLLIERANLSMKDFLEALQAKTNKKWAEIYTQANIDKFTRFKNRSIHATLDKKPNEVYNQKVNLEEVRETHLENYEEKRTNSTLPLKVGDEVLLARKIEKIRGKFVPKYEGPYHISEVLETSNPIMYKIKEVWGAFYRQQFKPVISGGSEPAPQPEQEPPRPADPNADTDSESISSHDTEIEEPDFNLDEVLGKKAPRKVRSAVKGLKYFHNPQEAQIGKRILRSSKK